MADVEREKVLDRLIAAAMAEHYRTFRVIDVNMVAQAVMAGLPAGLRGEADLADIRRRVLSRACGHRAARW